MQYVSLRSLYYKLFKNCSLWSLYEINVHKLNEYTQVKGHMKEFTEVITLTPKILGIKLERELCQAQKVLSIIENVTCQFLYKAFQKINCISYTKIHKGQKPHFESVNIALKLLVKVSYTKIHKGQKLVKVSCSVQLQPVQFPNTGSSYRDITTLNE